MASILFGDVAPQFILVHDMTLLFFVIQAETKRRICAAIRSDPDLAPLLVRTTHNMTKSER
jgi:hypothetical protein